MKRGGCLPMVPRSPLLNGTADMNHVTVAAKKLTLGEGGLAISFALLAFASIVGAAKAEDAPFAFHAYLAAAAGVASVFAIVNRYYAPPHCRRRRSTASPITTWGR